MEITNQSTLLRNHLALNGDVFFCILCKNIHIKKKHTHTHNGAEDVRRMPGEKGFIYTE